MADSKLITSFGEELECPVCAEYFQDARFLQCMHTFCLGCLEKCEKTYARGGKASMKCPLCRKVTQLGKGGVGDLRIDFMSNKLVVRLKENIGEREKAADSSSNSTMKCQSCSDGLVSAYCLSCCHFICGSCQSLHAKLGAMRTHEVIPMKELSKGNVTVVRRREEKNQVCVSHKLNRACFCYTCIRYVCELCVLFEHSEHECTDFEGDNDVGTKRDDPRREAIRRTVEQIAKKSRDVGDKKKLVKRLRGNVRRRFGEMRHQIHSTCDMRINTLTRMMKDRSKELEDELDSNEAVLLGKLASIDESLMSTESRILEARRVGENTIKDGLHAEIAFVHEYLQCVHSGLSEDDSNTLILKQIEQYSTGVHINQTSNEKEDKSVALLGQIIHPETWSLLHTCQLRYEDDDIRAIHFDASRGLFVVCSANRMYTVTRDGTHMQHEDLNEVLDIRDLAITADGSVIYILDDSNRVYKSTQDETLPRVIRIQHADSTLACVAVDLSDRVFVGDQTTKAIYQTANTHGSSSDSQTNEIKDIPPISPIQMTFTRNGDLVVVSRNDSLVGNDCFLSDRSGVAVRVFSSGDKWGNSLPQDNWQAAAITSCLDKKCEADGSFYALGIYVAEDGRQLASLAEYDRFGREKDSVFHDLDLAIDLDRGCRPRIAVDSEGLTLAVCTGREVRLYLKNCIAVGSTSDDD